MKHCHPIWRVGEDVERHPEEKGGYSAVMDLFTVLTYHEDTDLNLACSFLLDLWSFLARVNMIGGVLFF